MSDIENGREEGRQEGKREGKEEGRKEERIKIAKEMKKNNMAIEMIEKITGLKKETIEGIKV